MGGSAATVRTPEVLKSAPAAVAIPSKMRDTLIMTVIPGPMRFDNAFLRDLPGDPSTDPYSRQVRGALWSRVAPTPVARPHLVAHSREVVELLGLDPAWVATPEFAAVFGGNALVEGMDPYAMNYGGHQFGHWAGQLGDGRAIALGELEGRWELQLKGAGPTPYSRRGDGRAVLRSSIREFLCSEAMHHLGVPTTRALSLVATGDQVVRDMFYDGNPEAEPGAIVCRVAPSFLRFGTFELPASRQEGAVLEQLVDYTIRRFFPGLDRRQLFLEVCRRTAVMVDHWMRVGFVHGVMNTDNMSILGLTIDYGPYGWIDNYDPDWTPNTTDEPGRRYRFGAQPAVAHWNLNRLANALVPAMESTDALYEGLELYATTYQDLERKTQAAKLGLEDNDLFPELAELLTRAEVDMTIFFRALANISGPDLEPLKDACYKPENLPMLASWVERYLERARPDRKQAMDQVNPKYVLRNYLAQEAIDSGDPAAVMELLDVMRRPYDEQPGRERYAAKRPDWARNRPGCSSLSCSS
jgi:uncharacterized protein YdiU (UPF0061 family)